MVGGEYAIYQQVEAIMSTFGKNINYMGDAGSGQHTKMVNQVGANRLKSS